MYLYVPGTEIIVHGVNEFSVTSTETASSLFCLCFLVKYLLKTKIYLSYHIFASMCILYMYLPHDLMKLHSDDFT